MVTLLAVLLLVGPICWWLDRTSVQAMWRYRRMRREWWHGRG